VLRFVSRLVRNVLALGWTALVFGGVGIVGLLSFRMLARPLSSWVPRAWGAPTLWLLGVRVELRGEEHLADVRAGRVGARWPCVIVANHQSALDMPLMALLAPRDPLVMGKAELRWMPVFNLLWWSLGQAFVERGDAQAARATVASFVRALARASRTVLLAPEGTRTRDGSVGPFKRGAFRIAAEAGVPILPVVIDGAFACMPKGRLWADSGVVRLTVHPPVDTRGWSAEDAGRHADALRGDYARWLAAR
jgi:putative phosphoserine phosphatase/1-acylglycerol-3-phosphate O-acyltransferase